MRLWEQPDDDDGHGHWSCWKATRQPVRDKRAEWLTIIDENDIYKRRDRWPDTDGVVLPASIRFNEQLLHG